MQEYGKKRVPRAQKRIFSTKQAPLFSQFTSVLCALGCSKVLGKNGSQGPKKEDLKNEKTPPGTHPHPQVSQISA